MSTITNDQLTAAGVAIGIPAGKVIAITGSGSARWPDSRPALAGRLQPLFANNYLPASAVEDFIDALVAGKVGTPEDRAEAARFARTDNKFAATASVRGPGPSGHTNLPIPEEEANKTKAEAKEQAIKDDLDSAAEAAKEFAGKTKVAAPRAVPATPSPRAKATKSTARRADTRAAATRAADEARVERATEVAPSVG